VTVHGTVYLILQGESELWCNRGITVEEGDTLIITYGGVGSDYYMRTGKLISDNPDGGDYADAAGIGSREKKACGTIIFNGGDVTVTNYNKDGAGIGSGYKGSSGNLIFNSGSTNVFMRHNLEFWFFHFFGRN